jgi:hypothetical protein
VLGAESGEIALYAAVAILPRARAIAHVAQSAGASAQRCSDRKRIARVISSARVFNAVGSFELTGVPQPQTGCRGKFTHCSSNTARWFRAKYFRAQILKMSQLVICRVLSSVKKIHILLSFLTLPEEPSADKSISEAFYTCWCAVVAWLKARSVARYATLPATVTATSQFLALSTSAAMRRSGAVGQVA